MEFPVIPAVHAASSRIPGWLAYLPMLVAEETRLICPNHTHGGSTIHYAREPEELERGEEKRYEQQGSIPYSSPFGTLLTANR